MSNMDRVPDTLMEQHPLQRLKSPSIGLSSTVHMLGLASFAASFKYLVDYPNPANEAFGWHFQYLTIIGLTLATATFVFGLTADLTLSKRVFLTKNVLSFCSAPLEILISALYWSLRLIDRRLVLPEWAEMSVYADVGFHAIPAIMLAVDLLFFSPPWTLGAAPAFGISGIIALVYWAWVEACYQHNGWYPYPLFELLTTPYRVFLFVGSAIVMTMSTFMLGYLYGRINGSLSNGIADLKAKPGTAKR